MTGAAATWAGNRGTFAERWAQALAAHFHQTKFADGAELNTRTVLTQRIAQAVLNVTSVAAFFHVDEVDHDQATQVAQAHLARNFFSGLQVGAGGGFFNVATANSACRVNVHRHQRFSVVDHDGTATRQLHSACIGRFDLVLNLETREQGSVVAISLNARGMFWHDVRHELLRLVIHVVGVDQDVADVIIEIVTDRTDHKRRFLINQVSAFATLGRAVDCVPQFEQVI